MVLSVDKLHGSQSLSTTDGDNLSVCTTDTDEYRYIARRPDKPQLETLVVEVSSGPLRASKSCQLYRGLMPRQLTARAVGTIQTGNKHYGN